MSGPSGGVAALALARTAPAGAAIARRVSLRSLIQTRAWIGVVAFALIGIVTMQLLLLKLNTGIGHTLQQTTALQRANALLSVEDSEAGAPEAIEDAAHSSGMTAVAPGELHPISAGRAALARKAAKALRADAASASGTAAAAATTYSPEGAEAMAVEAEAEGEAVAYEGEASAEEATAYEGEGAEEASAYEGEEEASYSEASGAEAPEGESEAYVPAEGEAGEAEGGYSTGVVAGGGVEAGAGG